MKKISIEVPEALDRQIRVLAAQLDLNRSKFARLALQEKVERLNRESPDVEPHEMSMASEAGARPGNVSQRSHSTIALPSQSDLD